VDFVVLDTEPVQNGSGQIHVILGRPFLATTNALINYRNGVMKISFGNMTIELNIFDISKQTPGNEEVNEVYMVENLVHDTFIQSSLEDPLEACTSHFGGTFDIEKSVEEVNTLLDSTPLLSANKWQPKVVSLPLSLSPSLPSIVEPPKLELIILGLFN
jgi:hypothetical protein